MDKPSKNKYEEFVGFKDPEQDRSVLFDSRNARKTQTLFVDVNNNKRYEPIYTMRDQDYKGLISAYQVYMHSIDETDAALKLVGSLDHWDRLCELKWFREGGMSFSGVDQWRIDMQLRDEMFAKETLMHNAKRGDTSAARAILQMNKNQKTEKPKTKAKEKPEDNGKQDKIAQLHADKLKRMNESI